MKTVKRQKILLADDSVTIRKVIELTFADEGIDVVSVADGDAAMQKFVEIEPDLVIADVNMPGISGYQICEMIKQDETTCNIPVILLVGSFEPFDPGEALRVGSNYHFTKPFQSIRDFVAKVKEYLELGAFDNVAAETVDIDDLYVRSIYDEPDAEPGSEFEVESVHDESVETVETDGEPGPDVPAVLERVVDEPEIREPVYLGDAGMDDEIIETSHPAENAIAVGREFSTDPFDSPAEPATSYAATGTDELVESVEAGTGNDERPESVGGEEIADRSAVPLKFVIEDVEIEAPGSAEDARFGPQGDLSATDMVTPRSASPELIEMIANRVVEKLSDRAIRDVARETVPQIAEKLIREALDTEKKN